MAAYKKGSDIIHVATFKDENSDLILLSSLEGYGIELYIENNLVGKWGNNLTGFVDDYWTATGASEVTFKFPASIFVRVGSVSARLFINYTDTGFADDSLRDLYSDRQNIFNIVN